MANYQIIMYNAFGQNPISISDVFKVEVTRVVNNFGAAVFELPDIYPPAIFQRDNRIVIERQTLSGWRRLTDTAWLLRAWEPSIREGYRTLKLTAYDASHILNRRIVAYAAGSAQAKKTGAANDIIKAIVRENFGALATNPDRDISGYMGVDIDDGAGVSITKGFSRRNVLTVLQEIALSSALQGEYVAFDVIAPTLTAFQFRTYTNQRGADRRVGNTAGNPAVELSADTNTLSNAQSRFDTTDEITYVYAGGQGEEEDRQTAETGDTNRINASPLNRIEQFKDARNTDSVTGLLDEARSLLREGRPRRVFNATVNDGGPLELDVNYSWGDFVTATFQGQRFDCRIETLSVTAENGDEKVSVQLRSEGVIGG